MEELQIDFTIPTEWIGLLHQQQSREYIKKMLIEQAIAFIRSKEMDKEEATFMIEQIPSKIEELIQSFSKPENKSKPNRKRGRS